MVKNNIKRLSFRRNIFNVNWNRLEKRNLLRIKLIKHFTLTKIYICSLFRHTLILIPKIFYSNKIQIHQY